MKRRSSVFSFLPISSSHFFPSCAELETAIVFSLLFAQVSARERFLEEFQSIFFNCDVCRIFERLCLENYFGLSGIGIYGKPGRRFPRTIYITRDRNYREVTVTFIDLGVETSTSWARWREFAPSVTFSPFVLDKTF